MLESLNAFRRIRALVIGDCMLDRYVQGAVGRISPEAPVPIVAIQGRRASPGGAANVAAGLAALGAQTSLAGVIGQDDDGRRLVDAVRSVGIDVGLLASDDCTNTICKTRVLAEHGQHMLRLDEDGSSELRTKKALTSLGKVLECVKEFDVVMISDYDKGTLPPALIRDLLKCCCEFGISTVVDPKKADFSVYSFATVLTPNRKELERAIGYELSSLDDVRRATQEGRERWMLRYLVCTCGPEGMILADPNGTSHVPADIRQVADVAGAGDTVAAVLAASLSTGIELEAACRLASQAAGIAVMRPGVQVISSSELDHANRRCSPKIIGVDEAALRVERWRRSSERIVFTNGCFDVLHAGHLSCLDGAKRLGAKLIVGLNSDISVRRLKGISRPRIDQDNRAALLAGLECVDLVILFDDDTPESLIARIRPDVLVKGGDYELSQIAGAALVQSYGGDVVLIPLVDGLSTTKILASG